MITKLSLKKVCNSSLPFAGALLMLLPLAGCDLTGSVRGSGPVRSEERPVGAFSELKLMLPSEVQLIIGEQHGLQIEAQENLLPLIRVENKGDELRLFSDKSLNADPAIRVRLTAPRFDEIAILGYARVEAAQSLEGDKLEIKIRGSGDLNLPLAVKELEVEISGSGDIVLSGRADEADIQINGSGEVMGKDLSTRKAQTEINGSGEIILQVSEALTGAIRGSGDIRYDGAPGLVDVKIAGSGAVRQLQKPTEEP